MFCKVALPLPLKEAFDYRLPEGMRAHPGCRVKVPFGARAMDGVVVALELESQAKGIKEVKALLDPEPLVTPQMLEFTRWVADYYLCGWGEVLPLALPPAVKRFKPTPGRTARPSKAPRLTPAQAEAGLAIAAGLKSGKASNFLLHGVTGSGKTEVYLAALQEALGSGGGAIVLVPEIALTPQTLSRFEARFPGQVAVLHSALTGSERARSFSRLLDGSARVALGARSALFAPVKKLKLIVVDEESEPSYKQESSPRYHARDAALVRAKLEGAVALLGSATPSFESYANAKSGKLSLLSLPGRVGLSALPRFEFVDLGGLSKDKSAPDDVISPRLLEALKSAREAGEQSLLFLNRRGFAPVQACAKCGKAVQCPDCSISLTYHKDGSPAGMLRCHLCGHSRKPPVQCPDPTCLSRLLRLLGTGTQRLEDEVRRMMPGVRLARVDRDTTGGGAKASAFHRELGEKVRSGALDMLVGTQMLAKGLDFPNLTLVGVVNADASLAFPDFRAEERTFQLLVQVAGRAGRADKPGLVLVQTRQAEHPCLLAAARQDFGLFYESRISERRDLGYPPFGRLAALILRAKDKDKALEAATELAALLDKKIKELGLSHVQVLGPAPAPLVQVKSWWRYRLLLKCGDSKALHRILEPIAFRHRPKAAMLAVDVDPLNFL